MTFINNKDTHTDDKNRSDYQSDILEAKLEASRILENCGIQ
jgi:hypothetical protein